MTRPTAEQRFWAKVDKGDGSGCWLWTGGLSTGGYGRLFTSGRLVGAHRFSYAMHAGPIPDGLHIDHLCRVRHCVRPNHMEPVTLETNVLRGDSAWARNSRKMTCPAGHPYDGVNGRGARTCSTCDRPLKKARDARHRPPKRPDSIHRTADTDQDPGPPSSGV